MVVDAGVLVSRLVSHDVHHEASRAWLAQHVQDGGLIVAPAILMPEIAGAIARRTGKPRLAARAVNAVLRLPGLRLVAIDEALAHAAAGVAGRFRIRGTDAVYIATAADLGLPLATWDIEQRQRAARIVDVVIPSAQ